MKQRESRFVSAGLYFIPTLEGEAVETHCSSPEGNVGTAWEFLQPNN